MADQQQPTPAGEPAVLQALPRGLTPFSADELEELRLYRELVAELSDWELANRQMIELVIGAGGVIAKDIDRDSLVALATTFRKLGWLQKEPATFSRVRNLLGKHAHQAGTSEAGVVSQWLQDLKDLKTAALRQSRVLAYELEHPDGTTETITPTMTLDMLINGVVFHSDKALRKRWQDLGGWKSPALVLIAMVTIWDLIRLFQALDQVVEKVLATPALARPSAPPAP